MIFQVRRSRIEVEEWEEWRSVRVEECKRVRVEECKSGGVEKWRGGEV
ncbi:hypothetical protein LX69_03366 [Breznakibacter xylanolyticus]|uniref:Uncharacterized protein n=1 Tax=Breznakibacter xylanolyticus TaxID=990 RepID=A0A2W7NBU3_9BACT|nr:hypothetical protein LX69_03366 [Breznakibacter xylanolyticus]